MAQGIYVGGQYIPAFNANDFQYTGREAVVGSGDAGWDGSSYSTPYWSLNASRTGNYFPAWAGQQLGAGTSGNNWNFNYNNSDWGDQSRTNYLQLKSGDKEGTIVPFTYNNGQWVPQQSTSTVPWDTNAGNRADLIGLGSVLGAAGLGYMFAPAAGAGAGAEAAAGAVTAGGAAGGAVPAWAPSLAGTTFQVAPIGMAEAGLLGASGLTAAEIATLGSGAALAGGPMAAAAGGAWNPSMGVPQIDPASGPQAPPSRVPGAPPGAPTSTPTNQTPNPVGGLLDWMKNNPGTSLALAGLLGGLTGNAGSKVEDLYGGRKTAIDRLNANRLPAGPWGRY